MLKKEDIKVGNYLRWYRPKVGETIDKITSITDIGFRAKTVAVLQSLRDDLKGDIKVGKLIEWDTAGLTDQEADEYFGELTLDNEYMIRLEVEREVKEIFNG